MIVLFKVIGLPIDYYDSSLVDEVSFTVDLKFCRGWLSSVIICVSYFSLFLHASGHLIVLKDERD